MFRLFCCFALAIWLVAPAPGRAQRAADTSGIGRLAVETVEIGGLRRTAWIWLPPGHESADALPAVLVFHGGGGSGRQIMSRGDWRAHANASGFVAVFPDGTSPDSHKPIRLRRAGQTWNDGSGRQTIGAIQRGTDDIAFIDALLDRLLAGYPVDPERVFAAGHSNGASMTFHAARLLDGRFAGIAPVAGSDFAQRDPEPSTPLPLVYITGTEDPLNPFDGGRVFIPPFVGPFTKPAVIPMIRRWARAQDCRDEPVVTFTLDGVETRTWSDCAGGARVVLHAIEGHGHTWPGAPRNLPEFLVGPDTSRIDATAVILDFFAALDRQ